MKKKLIYFVLSLILIIIGYTLISPESIGFCKPYGCMNSFRVFAVGQPLFFGILPITLTFLVLLFIKNERIGNLYKIFLPYFLVSVALIFAMPLDCSVFDPICITKSTVAIFLGLVFFIFSMVKIIRNKS